MLSLVRLSIDASQLAFTTKQLAMTANHGPRSASIAIDFATRSGTTYEFSKTVGIATSQDSSDPQGTAATQAKNAPAFTSLLSESQQAWADRWRSDIVVPDDPALQREIRAAQFYLQESIRPGTDWSISPGRPLLRRLQRPRLLGRRDLDVPVAAAAPPGRGLAASSTTARTRSPAPGPTLRPPATPAPGSPGRAPTTAPSRRRPGPRRAPTSSTSPRTSPSPSGSTTSRPATRAGWRARAGRCSRARRTSGPAGRPRPATGATHITGVEGPDEHHWPVDDEVYTNAAAITTLRLATQAAALLGKQPTRPGRRSPTGCRCCWTRAARSGRSSRATPATRSSRPTWSC